MGLCFVCARGCTGIGAVDIDHIRLARIRPLELISDTTKAAKPRHIFGAYIGALFRRIVIRYPLIPTHKLHIGLPVGSLI